MSEPENTLSDVTSPYPLEFSVGKDHFRLRKPTSEEYDDAQGLQRLTYRRTLAKPEVQALADLPCDESEILSLQALLMSLQAQFDDAEDGEQKADLLEQIADIQATMDTRTLAQQTASERASLVRDRWLCARLLLVPVYGVDGDTPRWEPAFDTNSKEFAERWEALPIQVKDAARSAIWRALSLVRDAPFSLDLLRRPKSN